ncbi:MAG TPA: SRPBCC family protein [Fimbriimonadaceae bacterium]|nr:SRPBCC family protein [Fimbriimonadaceae bacterium]
MPTKRYEIVVDAPQEAVWRFHASADALRVLTPPGRKVELLSEDLAVRDGAIHRIRVRQFGLPLTWVARISDVRPPEEFVDTAEQSPFRSWRHRHRFESVDAARTRVIDTIEYSLPLGPLGALADRLFVSRDLDHLFAFRHEATRRALDRLKELTVP